MQSVLKLFLDWVASLLKSRRRLQAENLILRHQLNILRRRVTGCPQVSATDRLGFISFLAATFPEEISADPI
jgi:hypothetical protein